MKIINFDEKKDKLNPKDKSDKQGDLGDDYISKVNIDKFRDPSGLTIKKLNFGLWYLENKKILTNFLYVFLIIIGIITWFSFFKTFGYYVLIGMKEDQKLVNEMVQNPGIDHSQVLKTAAQAIKVESVDVILNSNGNYDIIAKISNVNKKYFSRFSYSFSVGGEEFGPFNDFILPEEEKFLVILNQEFLRRPSSINLEIENSWSKLDGHFIKDWATYKNNFIDFSIDNKVFSNPRESNLSEKLNLSVVEFDITNNTAYSYYEVGLDILLYSSGKLVSASKYPLEKLLSGETRHVNITWPGKVIRADTVEVIPNIDIMNENIMFIP